MRAWLARQLYSTLLRLGTPAYLWRVWSRGRDEPAYRHFWPQRLGWHAGAAFDIEAADPVEIRIWSKAFWALPWRIEHPYKVRSTLDSVQTRFGIDVRVKIR